MKNFEPDRWYPVASQADVVSRHVYQTELQGQELALWRDDNGVVNAWENRCPHRGMRFSMGVNMGNELRCQYHGWSYESGSGACTFVPAHRTATNPTSACAHTFAVKESDGIVWASLGTPEGEPPSYRELKGKRIPLRSLPFNVDVHTLKASLEEQSSHFAEYFKGAVSSTWVADDLVQLKSTEGEHSILLHLQPHSANKSVAHALAAAVDQVDPKSFKAFAVLMSELRRTVEKKAPPAAIAVKTLAATATAQVKPITIVPPQAKQSAEIVCKVTSRVKHTDDIVAFELTPVGRPVPQLAPGMHVSVVTPSGLTRQYSVVNKPDERHAIVIGVKREAASRGGSQSMHDAVQEGTELTITIPKNGFPLRRNGRRPVLIAGGIGITPILAMAQALSATADNFEMHYFVRGPEHTPFTDRLTALAPSVHIHGGMDAGQTGRQLQQIFEACDPNQTEVYTCGPGPMIDAVSKAASARGIHEEHIRFEYFKNDDVVLTGDEFDVTLLKSGKTFRVAADKTLLKACLDNGVQVDASCEQGVCGTCMTAVVSGTLEHNDTYLSKAERESGKWIMPCVSRCKSGALVLDL